MNRILKALGAFALTLVLVLSLAATGLCAAALERSEEVQASAAGYLVILKDPEEVVSESGDEEAALFGLEATLFAAQSEREELIPLAEEMGIYKTDDLDSIQNLVWSDQVELIEPDYEAQLFELDIDHPADPNDDYFQSHYQFNLTDIHAQSAWDAGLTGEGVTVAVIDSGLNVDHLDVPTKVGRGRYYFYREEAGGRYHFTINGVTKDYNYYSNDNISDNKGHGTMVSGIIAASTNNAVTGGYKGGIAGIAPNVTLMPVRCFTSTPGHLGGYTSNLISGINYAVDNGADIINMSWGLASESAALKKTINNAATAGCILIAAAGNDGDFTPQYPAAWPNVISVGSTNKQGGLSDFSQRTETVDICAPGGTLGGQQIYSLWYTSKDGIGKGDGTSFSAPLVAGAAALLKERDPSMTQADFLALLRDTSDLDRIAAADRPYAGYGLLNLKKLLTATGHSGAMLRYGEGSAVTIRAAHFPTADENAGSYALVMIGAYNPAGHLLDSRMAISDMAAGYGAFSLTATFQNPEAATLKAYFLDSATLVPLGQPVEVTIAQ